MLLNREVGGGGGEVGEWVWSSLKLRTLMLRLTSVVEEHMAPSNETFHHYNRGGKMIYNHGKITVNPLDNTALFASSIQKYELMCCFRLASISCNKSQKKHRRH